MCKPSYRRYHQHITSIKVHKNLMHYKIRGNTVNKNGKLYNKKYYVQMVACTLFFLCIFEIFKRLCFRSIVEYIFRLI